MNVTYTVKAGDTLYGISNQFGVSVTELANLNNVKADTLKIGQVLNIPSSSGTNPDTMFMYTVKKGDTLTSIAKKYNTTVPKIINLNNLSTSNLSIGQVLRIPEMYTKEEDIKLPSYINYTVKKGDTLYSIAKEYGVSIDTIIKDNSLTSNNLKIGQNLRIRSNVSVEVEDECFGEEYVLEPTTSSYTVSKGDTLYSIANRYNVNVSDIIRLNNLSNNNLSIGQKLLIPSSNNQVTYVVKKGDSLYSIARKYNTTVDSIKSKNNLKTNLLNIGQTLII